VDNFSDVITVEDRLAILDLFARQSHCIDGGDAAGWAATYALDGSFHSPTYKLTATGRTALTDFAENSNSGAKARGEQFRHHVSAVRLTPKTATEVASVSYLMILATTLDGTRVDRSVRMFDELVKVEGEWLVASRTVLRDDAELQPK
jgi:hypothetical protein